MDSQADAMKSVNSAFNQKSFQSVFHTQPVHMVAPASGVSPQIFNAIKQLNWPSLIIPNEIFSNDCIFHANSDEARFDQLVDALFDESISIIWALRGGYGTARLLNRLRALPKPKSSKWFIGLSDITALHLFFSQYWQWHTIHGSGLGQLVNQANDPDNFLRIADIIGHKVSQQSFTALSPLNHQAEKAEILTGFMHGGNLTLVENSIGTFWQIKAKGSILFLEETGEKGYRVDRSLYHLLQASVFSGVNAVLLGDFLGPDQEAIQLALKRFAAQMSIPVFKTNQFGHGALNYPIQYGAKAEITPYPSSESRTLVMHTRNLSKC